MADRSNPKPGNSPIQPLGGRELARSPEKLDSGPTSSGLFAKLPTTFGRFRVLRLLGHGAMGSVYLAFDPEIDREVALKIPKADLSQDPILWSRFQLEARAAGDLNHAYICGMYEVGQIGSTHFLSVEYVPGRPLKDYISDRQPQRKVAGVVRKLALGLAHAHAMGIVHRDLKPLNVMIDMQGEPKLMDFGLVRRLDMGGDPRATQAGVILGSPGYMAPEQALADHDRVGPATDIYGLGVVLFEMLTGSLPFNGTVMQVLTQIATQPPPRPSTLRPDVDPQLEELCLRMLEKNPHNRPKSMDEVAQTLTTWMKSRGTTPPESRPAAEATPTVVPAPVVVASAPLEVTREEKTSPLDHQKKRLAKLLEQREFSAAVAMLEKMTQPVGPQPGELTAWAVDELVKVRGEVLANDPVAMAMLRAEQKVREHDYAAAADLLEAVPSQDRSRKAEDLLQKSVLLRDECDRLRRDIEQSIYAADAKALPELVDELLKRQPSQTSVHQLADDLKRLGPGRTIAKRRGEDFAGEFKRSVFRFGSASVAILLVATAIAFVRGFGPSSRAAANHSVTSPGTTAKDGKPKQNPSESESRATVAEVGPQVELVDELTGEGSKRGLWVSPDALHIYWEHDKGSTARIYVATRLSSKEPFGESESVLDGRSPTLSADELTLIFTVDEKLHSATRDNRYQNFGTPQLIEELQKSTHVKMPSLTADGLHLVWFNAAHDKEKKKFWIASRPSPTLHWSKPQELSIKDVPHLSSVSWPQLLDGGRTLLCSDESHDGKFRFVLLRRESVRDSFRQADYLDAGEIEGVFGRAPHYIPATDELYFLSPNSQELTTEKGDKLVLKDPIDIFRLTRASRALGNETCEMIQNE